MQPSADPADQEKRLCTNAAVGLELLAPAIAIGVALALMQDERATGLHAVSAWTAVVIAAVPLASSVARASTKWAVDALAAAALLVPMLGSFTIGGLALGIPSFLLVVAALLRYTVTPAGLALQTPVATGLIVIGSLVFVTGALSMGASMIIAPVGLLAIVLGVVLRRQSRNAAA